MCSPLQDVESKIVPGDGVSLADHLPKFQGHKEYFAGQESILRVKGQTAGTLRKVPGNGDQVKGGESVSVSESGTKVSW
jgi:hypothetical protein